MRAIDVDELQRLMDSDEDVTVINVLPPEQHEKKHVPGSINIPLSESDFEERVEEAAGGKSATVVVYCANEDCDLSPQASRRLDEDGFEDVIDFKGGVEAWDRAGLEVETAS